ncbi:MAG: hypothetical protein QOH27_4206 [Mycobacterium sp.]|jgi:hypothetical protein|nr:hypothetical protein [Mycobacterium sp.]
MADGLQSDNPPIRRPSCSRRADRLKTMIRTLLGRASAAPLNALASRCDGARGEGPRRRIMKGVGDVSEIGCVGSLIVATRGFEGAGEVLLNVRGSKEAYLAWSSEPLARGTEVLVIGTRGPRTVLVEPWPGFYS